VKPPPPPAPPSRAAIERRGRTTELLIINEVVEHDPDFWREFAERFHERHGRYPCEIRPDLYPEEPNDEDD
jgi:hypothetical protein